MANYAEIIAIKSPQATADAPELTKLRTVYNGGDAFKNAYIQQHRSEDLAQFERRKSMTYPAAIARSALLTYIHGIGRKIFSTRAKAGVVRRLPPKVQEWFDEVKFELLLQTSIIPDLLVVGGTYSQVEPDRLIILPRESIQAYSEDQTAWLWKLQTNVTKNGLIDKTQVEFWYYSYVDLKPVLVRCNSQGELISQSYFQTEKLPIAWTVLPYPIMRDIADYQVASVNLASVDVDYLNRSAFPVYTEQKSADESTFFGVAEHSGSALDAATIKATPYRQTGNNEGITYPVGVERPGFISPSPENTVVSMTKQQAIEEEMYRVLDLSSATMQGQVQSGVAQAIDRREQVGLENLILGALEEYEWQVFELVKEYTGESGEIVIEYPYETEQTVQAVEPVSGGNQ